MEGDAPRSSELPLVDRELSWLAFNGRVLQEAADPSVPLYERLGFLAIVSSNLDEFFRVRVASLRSLLRLEPRKIGRLGMNPARLLREIHAAVSEQQERFGEVFRTLVVPELEARGVFLVDETGVTPRQAEAMADHYRREVAPLLDPVVLDGSEPVPFLENRGIYLVVELWPTDPDALAERPEYGLVDVPAPPLPRFVPLPPDPDRPHPVAFLDDVVRAGLPELFPGREVGGAYAVKLSRDAELYLEDEFSEGLVGAIRKALKKREVGPPSRFLYDLQASYALLHHMKATFGLVDEDLVAGARYHNFSDFAGFPRLDLPGTEWEPWPPRPHPVLSGADSILDAVREKDRLLHFPYQSYRDVVRFLREAAADPDVEEIWLTVYRVSDDSEVLRALLDAAERGKRIRVFVEVQARFDEASNLRWGERLEGAGIVTLYSMEGLKVHAKIALVVRREAGEAVRYAYLGTGNFNEATARYYTDLGLLTAHPGIAADVREIFGFLAGEVESPSFEHLLVAPFHLRGALDRLIRAETEAARRGEPAAITAKMNALEDERVIAALCDASRAGVPVDLVVRGICCLAPGVEGASETVRIRSIVDRYLEHWRAWVFHAGGRRETYLASADWMHRNLSRRVEIAVPLLDADVRGQVQHALEIQLRDNVKARVIDSDQANRYVFRPEGAPAVRAQEATWRWVGELSDAQSAPVTEAR